MPPTVTGNDPSRKTLCLVIPTYNERDNIQTLIERIEKIRSLLTFNLVIQIVDDNSPDNTAEIVKELVKQWDNIRLMERPQPTGLGSAYLDGFSRCFDEYNPDFLGEMDADLQHPPEILPEMCRVASSGKNVVIASRYVKGGGASEWSIGRKLVSKGANILTKLFLRAPVSDATSGFRILSSSLVKGLLQKEVSSKGYAFQVESLYVYKKLGASFAEVPFEFEVRRAGKTKLSWKEILRFAKSVIKTGVFGVKDRPLPLEAASEIDPMQVSVERSQNS